MSLGISNTETKINNFGENFCTALQASFMDNGLDDIFSQPVGSVAQGGVSCEIYFALGPAINIGIRPDTGSAVQDAYSGTLTIKLRSARPQDGPSALVPGILSEHYARAARINAIMQIQDNGNGTTVRSPFNTSNLPYYSVKFTKTQGIVPYTDWDFQQDVMEMTYALEFSIIPTAWA